MFTDLIKIEYPSEAEAGSLVTIQVYIKNQYSQAIYIAPLAVVNDILQVVFIVESCIAQPGETYYFTGTFTMPNAHAVIRADSLYWGVDGQWHKEDYQTRTVKLITITEYSGSITKVELEYNSDRAIAPVADVPNDKRGLVHIRGRNDASESRTLGIGWVVTDPDGIIIETHENDWAFGSVGAGEDREFIGGRFDLSKLGTYYISINLYENSSDPVVVDTYEGKLCGVTEALKFQTLEIDITPVGRGYVITDPASEEGKTEWHNDETGKFPYGTSIKVTAIPVEGWVFEKWADGIVGGISYSNPSYVQSMTKDRAVKAHFIDEYPASDIKDPVLAVASGSYNMGESVSFNMPYDYKGKAQGGWLTISLGTGTFFTLRHTFERIPINFEYSADWVRYPLSGKFTLPNTLEVGEEYSVRARLETEDGEVETDTVWTVITIIGEVVGEVTLIQDYDYPSASDYIGQGVEECTFKFSLLPEQVPGTDWFENAVIQAFTDKVEAEGGHMLKLRIWRDTTPTLTTDYIIEATSTASPLPWTLIIVGVLAILFLVTLSYTVIQIREFLWGEDGVPVSGFGEIVTVMGVMLLFVLITNFMPKMVPKVETESEKLARKAKAEALRLAEKAKEKAKEKARKLIGK